MSTSTSSGNTAGAGAAPNAGDIQIQIPRMLPPQRFRESQENIPNLKVEREAIRQTLALTEGNRKQAAKLLQIGERTLYRKIEKYDL